MSLETLTLPETLDIIRVMAGIIGFGIAAYYDLKTRTISDRIWNGLVILGALLFSVQVLFSITPLQLTIQYFSNIAVAMIIGWTIYLLGYFGGADMKAITAVAVLFPAFPSLPFSQIPLAVPLITPPLDMILPLTTISFVTNTAIFGAFYPIVLISRGILKPSVDSSQRFNEILSNRVQVNELQNTHGKIIDNSIYNTVNPSSVKQYYLTSRYGVSSIFLTEYLNWFRNEYNEDATISTMNIRVTEFIKSYDTDIQNPQEAIEESNPFADSVEDVAQSLRKIQERETVLVTPGFPFIVPMFFAILGLIVVGDVFFYLISIL